MDAKAAQPSWCENRDQRTGSLFVRGRNACLLLGRCVHTSCIHCRSRTHCPKNWGSIAAGSDTLCLCCVADRTTSLFRSTPILCGKRESVERIRRYVLSCRVANAWTHLLLPGKRYVG